MPERAGTLVIVPCGKSKIWDRQPDAGPTAARVAYVGSPFKVNREYAERFGDAWVVLSARYGFLAPADVIPGPYEVTFKRRSTGPVGVDVLREQVDRQALGRFATVLALGGKDYRGPIEAAFAGTGVRVEFPFAGMALGVSLGAVKRAVRSGQPTG
jgi:hypothetical protein